MAVGLSVTHNGIAQDPQNENFNQNELEPLRLIAYKAYEQTQLFCPIVESLSKLLTETPIKEWKRCNAIQTHINKINLLQLENTLNPLRIALEKAMAKDSATLIPVAKIYRICTYHTRESMEKCHKGIEEKRALVLGLNKKSKTVVSKSSKKTQPRRVYCKGRSWNALTPPRTNEL